MRLWRSSHTTYSERFYHSYWTGPASARLSRDSMSNGMRTAAVALLATMLVAPAFAQGPGADTYKAKCAMCHGADGLAATPMAKTMKVVSFKDPTMVSASDAQLIAATTNGKNKMPAYTGKLTDTQIKDVVACIRTLQK